MKLEDVESLGKNIKFTWNNKQIKVQTFQNRGLFEDNWFETSSHM